jgi:hypothetical protein
MCSKEIRTELFISNYSSKSFDLYDQVDAIEALVRMIEMVHASQSSKEHGYLKSDLP